MKGYTTEVFRKVRDNESGFHIQIRPSGDFPGNVALTTLHDVSCAEYFGRLNLDIPAEFMRQIGEALIAAADEVKGKE